MDPSSSSAAPSGCTRVLEVLGNAIVGGMETCVARLIEAAPRDRYSFTVLCPFESDITQWLRQLGAEVLITPMGEDPSWSSIMTTCAVVQSGAIDVLHAHLSNAHQLAGIVGRICARPVLTTVHSSLLSSMDVEVHRLMGTHVTTVCRHAYFHALNMGVDPAHLTYIHNGVDTERFKPGPERPAGLRQQIGIPDDAPLVGFVGRLSPEKGPEVFVRSALLLDKLAPRAHCVLVGEGPMRAELADLIVRYRLQERVHLVGVRADMAAVYRELDVVVSSSHSEAMSLALMEAMSSGLPVVATRVGSVPDLVVHGGTGWLTGPRDFDGLARRVAELLNDREAAARMGARARQRMLEHMTFADSLERNLALLGRLAARGGPSDPPGNAPRGRLPAGRAARRGNGSAAPRLGHGSGKGNGTS